MTSNSHNLQTKLAEAQQELFAAQTRIAELEAQLSSVPQASPIDRRILDNLLEGCQIIGFDWRYIYVNDAAARFGRQSKSELLGHTLMERYPGIEATEMFAVFQRCMTERIAENTEFEVVYSDGSQAWFEFRIQPAPEGIFVLTVDINLRKQAEALLQASQQHLRFFVEHAPAAIAMFDRDMKYLLVSRRWLTDYQLEDQNIIGRSHYEVFPGIPERWKAIYQRCLHGMVESSDGEPVPRGDGTVDWVHWEIQPWRDANGEIGGLALFSEVITERKQAEQQLHKLNRTLGVLSDINQVIVRVRPVPMMFEAACRIAVEKGGFRMAWVAMVDEKTQHVYPVAHAGVAGEYLQKLNRVLDGTAHGYEPAVDALHSGEPVVINDMEHDPRKQVLREDALQLGFRAMAMFPLKGFGQIRAALCLYTDVPDFFDDEELKLLNEMAADISFAMEFAEQELQRQEAEATLRASEEKFRSLIESSDSVIAMFDADGVFRYANPIAADALQLTPETLVGKHMNEVFPPEVAEYQLNGIRHAIETGEGALNEVMSFAFGENRWYHTSVQPVRDASGTVTKALINAVDITRIKAAEAELRKAHDTLEQKVEERTAQLQAAKEQVEAILENSLDGILLVGDDYRILRTNYAFELLVRCTPEQCINRSLFDLIAAEDKTRGQQAIERIIAEHVGSQIEVQIARKDGSVFDAEIGVGQIKGGEFVCTIRDVTERKEYERPLRYYASLQESISDAVIATDCQFRIQSWNRAAELIYGWRSDEVIGKKVADVLQTQYESEQERKLITEEFLAQGHWQGEFTQRHKDGHDVHILGSTTLFRDKQGVPTGVVSVNRDYTERRAAERALRASEERHRQMFERNIAVKLLIDPQTGSIVDANPAAGLFYGYSLETLKTMTISDINVLSPDRVFSEMHLAATEVRGRFEFQHRLASGEVRDVQVYASPLLLEGRTLLFSIVTDITERKRAEDALREYAVDIHDLYNNAPCGYHSLDKDAVIVQINDTELRWLGYERDEVVDRLKITDIFTPESVQKFRENFPHYIERGWVNDLEFDVIRRDGSIMHILLNGTAIYDENGQYLKSRSTMFDISELQHARLALNAKIEEEREFQGYLRALHEVTIELAQVDQVDAFYRRTVELGLQRLGLERLSLFLYDAEADTAVGTYGTDAQGKPVDEHHLRFVPAANDILGRALRRDERFYLDENVRLSGSYEETLGTGWNAAAILWNGTQSLGWLVADNLLSHKPPSKSVLDSLALYALSVGTLLARKRTDAALRESEARYRLLAENVSDVMIKIRPDGTQTFVSPSCYALLGYTPEEMLGKSGFEYMHPDDRGEIQSTMMQALNSTQSSFPFTTRVRRKTGQYVWVEVTNSIVRDPATGIAVEIIAIIRDITERKRAEETLRESEERFRQIAENIDQVLFVRSGDDQTMLYVNPTYETMWGKSRESLYEDANSFIQLVHPDDLDRVRQHIKSAERREEGLANYEYRINAPDAQVHWVRVRMFPIRGDDGSIARRVGIIEDITRQKLYEETLERALKQEKELSELKSRFVSMASHEFRTPLAAILSSTELLLNFRQKMDDQKVERKLTLITEQVSHLTSVIEDVLQLTRMQAHRVEFNPIALDPDNLCREIVEEFRDNPIIARRLLYAGPEIRRQIMLDKRLMRQIISNLVSNALKYSPESTPVTLGAAFVEKTLIITIRDEGIGIPQADLRHLFEPFHRAENVGTIPGTGLGLSITKEAVELHGGTIVVESDEGVGTIFTLSIPIVTAPRSS